MTTYSTDRFCPECDEITPHVDVFTDYSDAVQVIEEAECRMCGFRRRVSEPPLRTLQQRVKAVREIQRQQQEGNR